MQVMPAKIHAVLPMVNVVNEMPVWLHCGGRRGGKFERQRQRQIKKRNIPGGT